MTKFFLIPALLLLPIGVLADELEDSIIGSSTLPPFPDSFGADTLLRTTLEERMGITFSENNSVVLLHTGREKFNAMFSAIRQARSYIHLEYFNFRNDSIGMALFQLLGEKAKEGVEVRAMYDSFGNSSNDSPLKERHLKAIRAMGIQVEEFDPIRFPWINHAYHRDHRKIVVIDGAVCYAGGMNVADYYINGRPEYGEWRDMHMELTGDVVAQYQRLFARMWWQQTGEVLLDERYCAPATATTLATPTNSEVFNHIISVARPKEEFQLLHDSSSTAGHKVIGVVDRRPRYTPKRMRQAYVTAIDAAKEHIQIVNPYPTNVKSVRRALRRALQRGVRVEIMVSAKSDVPITPDVVALEMRRLAKHGAEVYYNQTGFHHSKVMMVDSSFCTIGSTNLDARSFLFDYEVNSFILDRETTAQLQAIFEQDKTHCTRFRAEDYRSQFSLGHRIIGRLFAPIRGFL